MSSKNPFPIIDGHNDTVLHLFFAEHAGEKWSFFEESDQGHIDLPRAQRGGFAGGFFAVFPIDLTAAHERMEDRLVITERGYEVRPFEAIDAGRALQFTMAATARLFRLERESKGQVKIVRTVGELRRCIEEDVLATILHFEGAEAIDPQLDALEVFYQAGLRSLGIVWSRPNAFGHGVPFRFPHSPDTGPGLTPAGEELVRACNRLGIMLDLSHLNEKGFWDVARISQAPLVVTHTAVHALCQSTRNLTDRQLDAVKASEGLVGLNFEIANMREDAQKDPNTPLEVMVRHIDYLVERLGIDKVGFGSDFDGGITIAQEIGDVAGLPKLIVALQAHGYDDESLRKLTHENWLRVLGRTWRA